MHGGTSQAQGAYLGTFQWPLGILKEVKRKNVALDAPYAFFVPWKMHETLFQAPFLLCGFLDFGVNVNSIKEHSFQGPKARTKLAQQPKSLGTCLVHFLRPEKQI